MDQHNARNAAWKEKSTSALCLRKLKLVIKILWAQLIAARPNINTRTLAVFMTDSIEDA